VVARDGDRKQAQLARVKIASHRTPMHAAVGARLPVGRMIFAFMRGRVNGSPIERPAFPHVCCLLLLLLLQLQLLRPASRAVRGDTGSTVILHTRGKSYSTNESICRATVQVDPRGTNCVNESPSLGLIDLP